MRRIIFGFLLMAATASPALADTLAEHLVLVRSSGLPARGRPPAARGGVLRASDVRAIQQCKDQVQKGAGSIPNAHEDPEPLPDAQLTFLAGEINRCLAGGGRPDLKVIPSRKRVTPALK
jgi:hypothetical protein